jgi:hypothetical protein
MVSRSSEFERYITMCEVPDWATLQKSGLFSYFPCSSSVDKANNCFSMLEVEYFSPGLFGFHLKEDHIDLPFCCPNFLRTHNVRRRAREDFDNTGIAI